MKHRRVRTLCFLAVFLLACVGVVYAASSSKTQSVTLSGGTKTNIYLYASAKAGISWWDSVSTKFYFTEEYYDNFKSSASETAILATFPTCYTYKTNGNKLLSSKTFTKSYRKYSYSGSPYLAYGVRLVVSIPGTSTSYVLTVTY